MILIIIDIIILKTQHTHQLLLFVHQFMCVEITDILFQTWNKKKKTFVEFASGRKKVLLLIFVQKKLRNTRKNVYNVFFNKWINLYVFKYDTVFIY